MNLSEQLRQAVRTSGLSLGKLEARTGLNRGAISRFLHGGGLETPSVDKLCEALGLRLTTDRKPSKGAGATRRVK